MRIPSGTTDRYVYFVAVDSTDLKTRETGLSSFTVYYEIANGTATQMTTPTVTESDATNMPGVYTLLIDESGMTTLTAGHDTAELCLHITQASMAPVTRVIEIFRVKITEGQLVTAANNAVDADIERLQGSAIATPTVAGVLEVDATHWVGGAIPAVTITGVPEVDVTHWIGTAAATPTVAGVPEVDITHFNGTAGTFAAGRPEVNTSHIAGSAVSTTTAQIGVNVVQISTDATAADNLEAALDDTAGAVPWFQVIDQGTAQSATATTLVLRAAAAFVADELNGATILIVSATAGAGQTRVITDYGSVADTATVDTWTTTPTGTIVYKIFATASSPTGVPAPVNVTQWLGTSAQGASGRPQVDVELWNGTAVPAEHTAGYPIVTVKDGAGTGEINTNAGAIALVDLVTTTTTATNVTTVNGLAANVITAAATAADFGTEVAGAVWNEDATAHQTQGTFGQAIGDPVADTNTIYKAVVSDAAGATVGVDVVAAQADLDDIQARLPAALVGGRMASNAEVVGDKTGYTLTSGEQDAIVDKVWDEAIAGHLTAGTTGKALSDAGAGGDPWATALPGAYGAGTAGKIVGDNLNATVSSRASSADLATAQADLDNLQTRVPAALSGGRMVSAVEAVDAASANKVADHTLRRTYANARASADGDAANFRSTLGAVGKLVNKWSISGGVLTVYQEDDVTATAPGGTQTVTGTPGADPITTLDTA